jgi:hypothetical protein
MLVCKNTGCGTVDSVKPMTKFSNKDGRQQYFHEVWIGILLRCRNNMTSQLLDLYDYIQDFTIMPFRSWLPYNRLRFNVAFTMKT